ncbi:MAG: ferredoxin thioredoxin reductase catalytic beta chain [Clostridiales bacterium]|nr:ferredoxin thioredoxin reductase catalytic beta chain [Clostridiales bacterium]MEE0128675.1 ferredoxin-thioredoxin reductase catalytic domain-containing protein [Eubacterium sp.]
MAVKLNPDKEIVKSVKEGLKRTGGYCPCRVQRTEDYKCICKEFREQIADPEFEGFCHCMLYYKSKDNDKDKKEN